MAGRQSNGEAGAGRGVAQCTVLLLGEVPAALVKLPDVLPPRADGIRLLYAADIEDQIPEALHRGIRRVVGEQR